MISKSFVTGILLTLVFLLAQCTTPTDTATIRPAAPLPGGVLSRTSVLTFSFSRGVVGPDSLNRWTATPYVEFTPSIPGKFVWQDTVRLVFSPDAPLPGDTRFRGQLNTALLISLSGASSFDGNSAFTFATESFSLKTAEFFYDRLGSTRTLGIKANLEFTYLVNPQDLGRAITLTIDGKPIPAPRVMTTENSKVVAIEIGSVSQTEKPRDIAVSFGEEIVSPETQTRLKIDKPFTFTLPGLEELKIYGHEFGYDGTTSWIRFKTSQEVDLSSAREFLSLDPVRSYTLEGNRQSFTLRGALEPGTSFRMTVKKGMISVLGGKAQNEYTADVVFGNIKPSFRFASETGVYMMLAGQKAIEMRTVNLPALSVRVSQVFQNNLLFFLDQGRYYDYYWDDEVGTSTRKYRYITGNYGRQLSLDTVAIRTAANQEVATWFDLTPYLNSGHKGFFVVEIADPAEAWRSTSKLVSISNLGVIAKQSSDELMVFASHLETTEPVEGALITLVSTNNQVIATQNTDRDGVARFSGFRELRKDFTLKLITAELGSDFNFLNLPDYLVETSRFDVSGKRDAAHTFDAFLYGDRNIYRPGEIVFLSGIVRNLTEPLPVRMPVRLKIYNPRGTVVAEQQFVLNEQGSFETQYQTLATSQTGQYRFELWTGNSLFLQSYRVSVEDFVPDRLKIDLTASREEARPGDKIVYDLQALNFFGPPAAGRNWEFEASFDIIPFQSKTFPKFRFADDGATDYTANPEILSGKTNEDGRARVEFALPQNLTSTGLLRARGRVAVFDESGRPVYQLAQTIVYPKQYYIGVQRRVGYYVSPNTPQKMQIVAVDEHDVPISGFKARVDLIRYEWHSVLRQHQNSNSLRYVSERREIPVKSDLITLNAAPTEYSFAVPRSGEYVIRVSRDGETGYNQFSFYAYDWATSDATSFAVDPEARVEMVLDKELYTPGDRARILFKTPFSGRMLVTIERNRVFRYHYLDVADNAASLEITIEDSYLPNVYVSAILFRKVGGQQIPLLVGHGFAPIMVEKNSNRLPVTITAPEKIRPKTRQRVTVTAGRQRNIFVTLAAVDEGICQVKNFTAPDPYGYFYAKKALETETYDFFRDLLPERDKGKARESSPGGGDDEAIAKRVNPLGVRRFKPVALWSGIRRTDANGVVEVELAVPEFSGELRLMALVYSGDRFGSAQKGMKVADPVIITPALPRFLSPSDSVIMAITAFNTTERPVSLQFAIDATGTVTTSSPQASLDLGPNQERHVNVNLAATREIGQGTVEVKTTAFGDKMESTTELPVRPVAPFVAESITGFAEGNTPVSHDIPDEYLPFGRSARIMLSPFPVVNLAKELSHLIGYPHGCIEQTVSRAFPQIYLRDIAALLAPEILNTGSPAYFVNEAITRIGTMQLADGTFAFWPGGTASSPWSTVYTTHFLLECRRAGYAVPEMMLSSALGAVKIIGRGKATQDYSTRDQQKTVVRRIADKSVLYALYVLALAGTPEKGLMDYYRNERFLLSNDTQILLAGAFALSGDRRTYLDLLPPKFTTEEAQRTTGLNFDSPVRANALILNTLLDTDLNNPDIPRYLQYLSSTYRSNRWFSTQDNAFTLIAFGKAARMASGTSLEGTITVGEKQYPYPGGTTKMAIEPFGKRVRIVLNGEGRVYYSLVTEGIRTAGAIPVEDKNLQVRRDFLDRSGRPVNIRSVRQNDLIIVKVLLNSSVDNLENIAITDLLPAGFEIENPRLTETTNYPFIRNATVPEYIDIRDDRINLYTSFRRGIRQQVFYYMVRAVTPGLFAYAPIVAEAMYNADYYSASGGTRVRVEQ